MSQFDSIPYYDYHSERLLKEQIVDPSLALAPLLSYLNVGSKVLDLGAGLGHDLSYLTDLKYDAYGVEGSKKLSEMAAKRGLKVQNKNLLLLNLKEAEFDAVWMNHVAEHFSPELLQRIIATCFRGVKVGGYFGLLAYEGTGSFMDRAGDLLGPSRMIFLYQEKQLCSMLEQTGFQVVKIGRKNGRQAQEPDSQEILMIAKRI